MAAAVALFKFARTLWPHRHPSYYNLAARLTLATVLGACSTVTPAQTSGPLAAYSFDAGSGTAVADVTGRSNTLNLTGPTWTSGHNGGGLSFDGVNDVATAASYNSSLNLAGRSLTLSAWIYRRSNSGWQIIVDKPYGTGHASPYFDWSLHVENSTGRIVAFLGCEGRQRVSNSSTPLNAWTHVAVTYDGSAIRHYINGALDRTTSVTCSVTNTNSRPIRVGANGAGTEVLNGRVDDVRIYNRPLSPTEIQNDMSTPLSTSATSGDSLAPTVSVTAPAAGATVSGSVAISASASDNVGVAGVQFKVDGSNVGSEDLSAPYSISWSTTQSTNGSHSITAIARDSAGNVRTSSAVTINVNNGGATAPTVTLTANPTSLSSGSSSTLSWSSTSASSCSASGAWSGSKPTSGSQSTGALASSQTYTLTCTGTGGSASRSVTVNVSAAAAPAPTVTLSASPASVASGGTSSLTWSSSDASSCNASGAWSGARPTSGSANSGALTAATNTFTLTCAGTGGSASRSVSVAVTGAAQQLGLDFPGSAATSGTIRFRFTNPLGIYPATYIWKVRPRQQNGYYTAFFWGNDGPFYWGPTSPDTYYGAHPYPSPPPNGAAHKWEISVYGDDYRSSEDVVYDRWYTQALRVWSDGSGKHHEFYWDLPDTSRVIRVNVPSGYGNIMPPSPALTFGDAPWNQSNEIMNGVMRGFQIYSVTLTVNDILAEINSPRSTANGASYIWYMNLNPTPSDIADKSGNGHNPAWVGGERPRLWSGQ